jgi:hypothetical protein
LLAFNNESRSLPKEFIRYFICRKMGWDYYTYMSQPAFFIDEIMDCIYAEEAAKKIKYNNE